MTKSIDAITELVRNPKPSFRKADDRPAKAQKHRYERRKIKEYIKISNWGSGRAGSSIGVRHRSSITLFRPRPWVWPFLLGYRPGGAV
jgi:hypothetical protein